MVPSNEDNQIAKELATQRSVNTGNSVFDIRSLTWDERSYPEGVILLIVTLGTIRTEDSRAARNATRFQH